MGGWAPLGTGLCQAGGMVQQLCTGGRASPPGHGLSLGPPSSSPSMGVRGSPGNWGLCSQHGGTREGITGMLLGSPCSSLLHPLQ